MYAHFKEETPVNTVGRIKEILDEMGLETTEMSIKNSRIGTSSMRVVFKGTNCGTNGKGVEFDYCKASAYAELMERYSNNYLNLHNDYRKDKPGFTRFPDEIGKSTEELINDKNAFLDYYFGRRGMDTYSLEQKKEKFESVNMPDNTKDSKNEYTAVPFYDTNKDRVTYLPYGLMINHYGSNGMAAGNTLAEAIVQGMAEIVERHVQREILTKSLMLPRISDECMKKYGYIWDFYQKIKEDKNFHVEMKDCTLGGQFPVAGLLVVEKNTGRYGLKLGCHPDFGVAMERTITEATQGGEISDYAHRSTIDFSNKGVSSLNNIMNSFATGQAQYPYQVLLDCGEESYSFDDLKGEDNKAMARLWIRKLQDIGWKILIRDNSWCGFPAVHILVPGISEAFAVKDDDIRACNTTKYLYEQLKNPSEIDTDTIRFLNNYLNYTRGNILLDGTNSIMPFDCQALFKDKPIITARYLSIICDISLGKFDQALMKMEKLSNSAQTAENSEDLKQVLMSEKMYLYALMTFKSHKKAIELMRLCVSDELVTRLDYLYSDPSTILKRLLHKVTEDDVSNQVKKLHDEYVVRDALHKRMEKTQIDQSKLREILF